MLTEGGLKAKSTMSTFTLAPRPDTAAKHTSPAKKEKTSGLPRLGNLAVFVSINPPNTADTLKGNIGSLLVGDANVLFVPAQMQVSEINGLDAGALHKSGTNRVLFRHTKKCNRPDESVELNLQP